MILAIQRTAARLTAISSLFTAGIGLLFSHGASAEAISARLVVAPDGAIEAKRADETPLSLQAALDEAARRRVSDPTEPLVIELQQGTYYLDRPISINERLTGEGGITIKARPGADVRLVGWKDLAEPLSGGSDDIERLLSEVARGRIRYYSLSAAGLRDFGIETPRAGLFPFPRRVAEMEFVSGDQPLSPARWPASGFSEVVSVGPAAGSNTLQGASITLHGAPLAGLADRHDVWLSGFLGAEWLYQRVHVFGVDAGAGMVRLARAREYPPRRGDFAALENAPSLFTAPGQFYLDRARQLLAVWPPDGSTQTIHATVLATAIEVENARNVRIEGISVMGVRGDAIRVVNSEEVHIEGIQVADTGMRGVYVEGGRNVTLRNSTVRDTGDEAVWLVGGNRQDLVPANHRIEHNVLLRFGRRTRSNRSGIWLDGVGNSVEANVIGDAPAQAIHFQGNDHSIRRNDISGIVSQCGDCGAIDTGNDWTARGSCIEDNVIHDVVPAPSRDVVGIYLDDGASGITVRRNVTRGLRRGILVGGGRDNVVTDNTIIGADQFGILLDARGVTWAASEVADPSSRIRRNLVQVPYNSEPYRSRYPHLADILDDEPGLPKYNRISANSFVGGVGVRLTDPALSRLLLDSDPATPPSTCD